MKSILDFLLVQQLLLQLLLFVPFSFAATLYVDPASTTGQNCGTSEAAACSTILRAMQLAADGDTIKMLPGVYSGVGNEGLANREANGTVIITATNVSLVGSSTESVLVVCTQRNRFLLSSNNFITYMAGFSVSNCKTPVLLTLYEMIGGAAFFINSNVKVEDMLFEYNFGESGGALGFDTSNATVSRSYFNFNNATVFGGGILCEKSQLQVSHSFFNQNRASGSYPILGVVVDVVGRGGAIFTSSGAFTIIDHCDFTGNFALISGAGLQAQYTNGVEVGFSTFSVNSVTGSEDCLTDSSCNNRGGALYFNDANFDVHDSLFINNTVSTSTLNQFAEGGAIYATASSVVTKIALLSSNQFYYNRAVGVGDNNAGGYGGAIYIKIMELHIESCDFENNFVDAGGLFTEYSSNGGALWFSSARPSEIKNCVFFLNHANQGTGGAVYFTDAKALLLENCTFRGNSAKSSYVSKAEGGAMVIAHNSFVHVNRTTFSRNKAEPYLNYTPYTFSGSGGAIFVQSASANISFCLFSTNHASTGQFDSGASGGAIGMIDARNTFIWRSRFIQNSARGYSGVYSYSNSGTGGALSVLFSSADISNCEFNYNWVSAGGTDYSLGGAISIFYENDSPDALPIRIANTILRGNIATGEICTQTIVYKAGEGGGIAIFGTSTLGVDMQNVTFFENIADTKSTLKTTSAYGGAMMLKQSSRVRCNTCNFTDNIANNGFADDISSVTDAENSDVYINITKGYFQSSLNPTDVIGRILSRLVSLNCDEFSNTGVEPVMDEEEISELSPWMVEELRRRAIKNDGKLFASMSQRRFNDAILEAKSIRRRLENDVVETSPSIIVGAGEVIFDSPVFGTPYTVFIGNVLSAILDSDPTGSYTSSTGSGVMKFQGTLDLKKLNLFSVKSTIIFDPASAFDEDIVVSTLTLLNSSFLFDQNVNVSIYGIIMGSTLASLTSDGRLPTISYFGPVQTGYFDLTELQLNVKAIERVQLTLFSPNITLNRCTLRIFSSGTISSVMYPEIPIFNMSSQLPPITLFLFDGATFNVERSADVFVKTIVYIYDEVENNGCGFQNHGRLFLGYPEKSENCAMDFVDGCFMQSKEGTLSVTLPSSSQFDRPLLTTASNATILGKLNISLYGNGDDTQLNLYGPQPTSNWNIFGFDRLENNVAGSLEIIAPAGLHFRREYDAVSEAAAFGESFTIPKAEHTKLHIFSLRGSKIEVESDEPRVMMKPTFSDHTSRELSPSSYEEFLYLDQMSCSAVSVYYNFTGVNKCSICLTNTSCGYCSESGMCVQYGTGECVHQGFENHDGNCCPEMCNGNGHCSSDLTCDCNFLYTSASNCKEYSYIFYLIIAGCAFIVSFGLLSLRYYISYRQQKKAVLEKLRKRLLSTEGEGDAREGGFVTNNFLKNLQQDLILRDVFVNNDEIKLESKIGEGSFGVVYKATFRGAQVAVKQMRSPVFMQLTQNDIDEFRKEAYMMSRLRHPNIVLVMGVSVVEQEPVVPTMKGGRPISMDEDMMPGVKKEDGKLKPVKSICIITEYLEQGSLADLLYGPNKIAPEMWSYELALVCALQAARGMLYLHSHSPPICHRDLKSSNLVVDDHWVVKVTDFGMSRMVPEKLQDIEMGIAADDSGDGSTADGQNDDRISFESARPSMGDINADARLSFNPMMTSNLGTTAWCAPELLTASNKTRYSVKVDVYSFGLVLWELWERKRPYDDLHSRFDIIDAIRSGKRPPISASCPPALKSLIQRCWHAQPARRPTFSYIVRYLKDELARIKRQRLAGGNSSGYQPPKEIMRGDGSIAIGPSTVNIMHNNSSGNWSQIIDVDEASPHSSKQSSGFNGPGFGFSGSNTVSSSPAASSSDTPTGSFNKGTASSAKGTWRDRYVMKFSGWQASRPDTGLPPSVTGTAQSTRWQKSEGVPIPPPPTRANAANDEEDESVPEPPVSSSVEQQPGIMAFSSMLSRLGTSPANASSRDSSTRSMREIERERDREREIQASNSIGLSMNTIEQTRAARAAVLGSEISSSRSTSGAEDGGRRRSVSI